MKLPSLPLRLVVLVTSFALLLALLLVQTARIEGFKVWPISVTGLKADLQEAEDKLAAAESEMKRRETAGIRIANEEKARHDQETARIRADADRLLVRGAGANQCRVPASPGGSQAAPSTGDPVVGMSDPEERIGLPFPEAVRLAQNHDNLRAEVIAWRGWHQRLTEEWARR